MTLIPRRALLFNIFDFQCNWKARVQKRVNSPKNFPSHLDQREERRYSLHRESSFYKFYTVATFFFIPFVKRHRAWLKFIFFNSAHHATKTRKFEREFRNEIQPDGDKSKEKHPRVTISSFCIRSRRIRRMGKSTRTWNIQRRERNFYAL